MIRRQESYEVCQFEENGEPCRRALIGTAWKFCPLHGVVAKRLRKREDSANYREDNRLGYNRIRFRHRHHLTKRQLEPLLDHAEPLQEAYACQDDFHEAAVAKIDGLKSLIIHPPADLPSAAHAARKDVRELLTSLEKYPWDARQASTRTRLILATKVIQRDIGRWNSAKALTNISAQAKAIQKLMFQEKDIIGLIHALLVHIEIWLMCNQCALTGLQHTSVGPRYHIPHGGYT